MKLVSIVGTRPEIIKMASVIRAAAARRVGHCLVHTAQHYSYELDGVFFAELGLPAPKYRLGSRSGSDGDQIVEMIQSLTPILLRERANAVVVQGDTNSVLAGALAARNAGIPLVHVEAGLRSYDPRMPEERNRLITDHVADWLFAPTLGAKANLLREGIEADRVWVTGNTVVDELAYQHRRALGRDVLNRLGIKPGSYVVATVHRRESVTTRTRLSGIIQGLARVGQCERLPILAVFHPRTMKAVQKLGVAIDPPIRVLRPLGYIDFLALQADAALVLTDSGGVQEEACCLGVPCVTLRDTTERPESVEVGANALAGSNPLIIAERAAAMRVAPRNWRNPFGDGRSGLRIVDALLGAADRML